VARLGGDVLHPVEQGALALALRLRRRGALCRRLDGVGDDLERVLLPLLDVLVGLTRLLVVGAGRLEEELLRLGLGQLPLSTLLSLCPLPLDGLAVGLQAAGK